MAARPKAAASLHEVNGKSATPGRANGNKNPGFADHPLVGEAEIDELVAKAKDANERTAKDYGKM
jgi:hypothetical protein